MIRPQGINHNDQDIGRFWRSDWKLPGGDWVICWGGLPLVTEQAPGGATVAHLYFDKLKYSYRAFPVPPGTLTAADLRHAMDRMARRAGAHKR